MNNLFLIGDAASTAKYIDGYITDNKFTPLEVEYLDDTIKIEDARRIKRTLGFKVKTKKLFVLNGDITIEAQNSLLKNIEEADMHTYFIFTSNNEETLLETVRSRCLLIKVGSKIIVDNALKDLLREICVSSGDWRMIDLTVNFMEDHDFEDLIFTLRTLLLENIGNESSLNYFNYCKKTLPLLSLVQKNNVNRRIVMESIFLQSKVPY